MAKPLRKAPAPQASRVARDRVQRLLRLRGPRASCLCRRSAAFITGLAVGTQLRHREAQTCSRSRTACLAWHVNVLLTAIRCGQGINTDSRGHEIRKTGFSKLWSVVWIVLCYIKHADSNMSLTSAWNTVVRGLVDSKRRFQLRLLCAGWRLIIGVFIQTRVNYC